MNILLMITLLILAAFAIAGWVRGFIRVFAHMFFFAASVLLVSLVTPYISHALVEYTPVKRMVEDSCREALQGAVEDKTSRMEQKKFIEGLGLPKALEKELVSKNNGDTWQEMTVENFSGYLAGALAELIIKGITFVIALLLVSVVLRMTVLTLDVIAKLPVLNGINRFLGLLLGAGEGLLVLWLAFLVISLFGGTAWGAQLQKMIQESPLLAMLYHGNLFWELLARGQVLATGFLS